ncbi:MAG: hypothetical protein EZS28_038783, partial [Streblomastix strix]
KILDASIVNEAIEPLNFQINVADAHAGTHLSIIPVKFTITTTTIIHEQWYIQYCYTTIAKSTKYRADSEGNQTQRQNTIARNSHTVMEIEMEPERQDINPPPLEAKINQVSFNGQRDYWATKSNLLKYIGKPGAG